MAFSRRVSFVEDSGTNKFLTRWLVRGSADTVGRASVDCLGPVLIAWRRATQHTVVWFVVVVVF